MAKWLVPTQLSFTTLYFLLSFLLSFPYFPSFPPFLPSIHSGLDAGAQLGEYRGPVSLWLNVGVR